MTNFQGKNLNADKQFSLGLLVTEGSSCWLTFFCDF